MYPCEDCHRPIGVHCCHNCKKDANKCGEYHGCGSCNAWENGLHTNADRIRAMSDEELAKVLIHGCQDSKCEDQPQNEYGSVNCFDCRMKWLQQPAED